MGLHVGGFIVWRGVLVAREPASRSVDKTSLSASRNADRLRNGLLRSVGLVVCVLPGQAPPSPTGAAARPRSCGSPMALRDRQRARLKPPSPLLVRACVGLKPPSPLRARNERFWCSFRVQRCRWFQWLLFGGKHWCCEFQSPASECTVRDFFRPARPRARASAKKFAQHAPESQKSVFYGVLGEFFAEMRRREN